MGMTRPPLSAMELYAILRVNQVTDYERIDHQQKSERAGPHAMSGRRALQPAGATPGGVAAASWSGPDASVGPTRAMTDSARLLGAKSGFDARLSGGGSYEGQCRCAFLLCRQENISERTPRLLGQTDLCRLCNELGGSEVWGRHTHEQACSVMCIVGT